MAGNLYHHISYRCATCAKDIEIPLPSCATCGPKGIGHFELRDDNSYQLTCKVCGNDHPSLNRLPSSCPQCHDGLCDWWDSNEKTWYQLDLSIPNLNPGEVWVKGDFDGDYEARLKPNHKAIQGLTGHPYFFDLEFKHSFLTNAEIIDEPPSSLPDREPRPFTQPIVFPVDVQLPKEAQTDEAKFDRVALKHFRLFNWSYIGSTNSSSHDDDVRFGRIKGTAYGVLTPYIEPVPEKKTTYPSLFKKESQNSTSSTDSKENNNPVADNAPLYQACLTCSFWTHLLLFILTWMACSFKTAIAFILFMQLFCWLDEFIATNDYRIERPRLNTILTVILLLVSAGALTIGYWPIFLDNCLVLSKYALIATGIALLLSTLLRSCLVKFLILLCLFLCLTSWCKVNNRGCTFSNSSSSIVNGISAISDQIDNLTDNDIYSDIVNDANQNNPSGRLISINQAIREPNLVKDCKNRVFIPFDFEIARVDNTMELKLNKLGTFIQKINPQKIIISGYTSQDPGDETPQGIANNIDLSFKRASYVQGFLVQNHFITLEKTEVRAYGSVALILQNQPQHPVNRRVEIGIQCPEQGEVHR